MSSATLTNDSLRPDDLQPQLGTLAGSLVLVFIAAAGAHYALIDSKLLANPDPLDITALVRGDELMFRLGMALDVVVFALGLLMAFVLYLVLRPFGGRLALFGLVWVAVQTALALVFESTSVLLLRVTADLPGPAADSELSAVMLGLILDARRYSVLMGMLLFGLAFTINFYLLFRSRSVPRAISGPGVVVFALSCLSGLFALTFPDQARTASGLSGGLGMLVLTALGLWLMIKGVERAGASVERQGKDSRPGGRSHRWPRFADERSSP